jgi:hypothetical protein
VNEASKSYSDYDWEKLYKTGRLKNLKVCELDKYVQHYNQVQQYKNLHAGHVNEMPEMCGRDANDA